MTPISFISPLLDLESVLPPHHASLSKQTSVPRRRGQDASVPFFHRKVQHVPTSMPFASLPLNRPNDARRAHMSSTALGHDSMIGLTWLLLYGSARLSSRRTERRSVPHQELHEHSASSSRACPPRHALRLYSPIVTSPR